MASRSKTAKVSDILDRLEAAYGPLVATEDPVEAGLMALLAEHAPDLAVARTRQALREWAVDWNEMRVADRWDIAHAIAPGGHDGARAFARTALRLLSSVQEVANRCSFDRALADPDFDVDAAVDRMRGVPPHARAVMKTVLDEGDEWKPDAAMSKVVQKLGLVAKTTSLAKVANGLAAISDPADRVRAHYLLARYAARLSEAEDPLAAATKTKKAAAKKTPATKTAAKKKASGKNGAVKPAAKKTAAKKTAAKKTAAKKTAAKKPATKKPATKKAAKKTTSRAAKTSKR